jgi:hypothetical protein
MRAEKHDERVRRAVHVAARTWRPVRGGPEAELGRALAVPLRVEYAADVTDEGGSSRFDYPGWAAPPRGIDLVVWDESKRAQLVVELKVEAVDEVLYDVFKLTSQRQHDHVEAGYLVVSATPATWAAAGNCCELFGGDVGDSARFETLGLFERNERSWRNLLGWRRAGVRKSVGCPAVVPAAVATTQVARAAADDGRYELRATRVEPGEGWLAFDGDWPEGFVPKVAIPPAYTPSRPTRNR